MLEVFPGAGRRYRLYRTGTCTACHIALFDHRPVVRDACGDCRRGVRSPVEDAMHGMTGDELTQCIEDCDVKIAVLENQERLSRENQNYIRALKRTRNELLAEKESRHASPV